MSAEITRIIRKPAVEHDDLCMCAACLGTPAAPKPEARCEDCHARGHSGTCPSCVYVQRMLASIPRRSRLGSR